MDKHCYGNFFVINDLNEMDGTSLQNIEIEFDAASEISMHEMQEIEMALKASDDVDLPPPETPAAEGGAVDTKKRFKTVSSEQQKKYEEANQSNSTKRNTVWALKLFQDWHQEVYDRKLDFNSITSDTLATTLSKFYCEARPKDTESRSKSMAGPHAEAYHKNTLKNIRAALNRHMQDIGRDDIDIVRDAKFKTCNKTLNGLLKDRMRSGLSRPTAHKEIISSDNLCKINTYLEHGFKSSPVVLRQAVWYNLAIHFVSRGLEFHKQLKLNSFNFTHDEHGHEYVTINHETTQKNFQGGLNNLEAPSDKRMYAVESSDVCPVKLLRLLMSKTDPSAEMLFNHYIRDLPLSSSQSIWYTNKSLAARTFANMMPDLCKAAGIEKRYTAHCLRATCIEYLSHAGYEARSIMFLSGHRNESSLRSYNRSCSTNQKKNMSSSLAAIASGDTSNDPCTSVISRPPLRQICDAPRVSHSIQAAPPMTTNIIPTTETMNSQIMNFTPSAFNNNLSSFTSGFLSNSTFNNCNFSFGPQNYFFT